MIKWAAPQNLYLLIIIPVLLTGITIYLMRKRMRLRRHVDESLILRITQTVSRRMQIIKLILPVMGLCLLIIGLARPKWGEKLQIYEGEGIEVTMSFGVSECECEATPEICIRAADMNLYEAKKRGRNRVV